MRSQLARHSLRVLLVAIAVAAGAPVVADADPKDASIVAVFRSADCKSATCDPARDSRLKSGAVVTGEVQVFVSARADYGLEWVRLEAQYPGDPRFYCIEFWDAGRLPELEKMRRWDTVTWTDPSDACTPKTCSSCTETSPHQHGALSSNLPHAMRVVAREQVSGEEDVSSSFTVKLHNAPAAPAWTSEPAASAGADGATVGLQWSPNAETDVVEYRFVRTSPTGARTGYAINAKSPDEQGCRKIGSATYRCSDVIPAGSPSGTYRYAVAAVRRASIGPACEVADGKCLVGPLSPTRSVQVAVPTRSGEPAPTGSTVATTTPSPVHQGGRAPVSVSPPPEAPIAAGPPAGKPRSLALPLGGFALALLAVAGSFFAKRLRHAR